MARSQQSFGKKERESKKAKKRKEKLEKRAERKAKSEEAGPRDMMAYVDEFGNIVDTPPDPSKRTEVELEDIVIGIPKQEKVEFDPIRSGRVDFFNDSKGFGFIKDVETQESYFVHINNCEEEIGEGDKVSFEIEKGPRGYSAVNVKQI